ncbi:hypothetical protein D3C72_2411360 [compost metagenome]
MPGQQQQGGNQSGQKPEDKMNKDWERSRDTGSQGGQRTTDKQNQNLTDKDRMGGQQNQADDQQWDKDR